jgi:uncharacterized protein (DUF924 family)
VSSPAAVLDFWLGPTGEDGDVDDTHRARWWKASREFDAEIRERFGALHEQACRGKLDSWKETPEGRVALIIVLDQFSRNLHRGDPRAFAQDARAAELTLEAIETGEDQQLSPFERVFLYMPLMHAEDRGRQQRGVECFTHLADQAPPSLQAALRSNLEFAERHRDIVAQFGRFPHRNAVLGRTSTPEEVAFLREPGSSF